MQELHYVDGTITVSDELAAAVLTYAAALARHESADVIEAPGLVDGSATKVTLLLGPASQLFASQDTTSTHLSDDSAIVEDLLVRIKRLEPKLPVLAAEADAGAADLNDELGDL
jgi:hypothetical protein